MLLAHALSEVMIVEPGDGVRVKRVLVAPPADTVFQAGEVLMLLGKIGNLNRFSELFRS